LAKHWAARRFLRRQRRPDGTKDTLGPNLKRGPAVVELRKGPDELCPSALGPPNGVGEEQGVVRSQQCPTPWASAGDRRAFDQLAQQQIALQLLQTALILMVWVASFAGSGGQPLRVG
jgi:hypothetical protein